jgi:hypothetical protein
MGSRTKDDRRQSTRYAMNSDVFLAFWPALDRVGKLKDVSSSGAAFEYPAFNEQEEVVDVEVDIFASRPSHLMLRRVPCKVVYDIKIEHPTLVGIETRRCGLRFGHLSQQHNELLKTLLSEHVSHPLPVRQTAKESKSNHHPSLTSTLS